MTINRTPFITDGVIFNTNNTVNNSITDAQVAIGTDDNGNMIFRDKYINDVLSKESISLQELYNRVYGVYSELNSNGLSQLFFQDGTVSRPYSLKELVDSTLEWKKNKVNGSLWWIGREEFDHTSCGNLPISKFEDKGNVLWSVDRYLSEVAAINSCSDFAFSSSSQLLNKWWDVQNMEIILPPIDSQKSAIIVASLAYASYNSPEPILFRLYDATTQTELARTAVINAKSCQMQPVTLSYFGPLQTSDSVNASCVDESCGCETFSCLDGDANCIPNTTNSTTLADDQHVIKIQFLTIDYHDDHNERVFGNAIVNIDNQVEVLTKSYIDATIFNTSPDTRYARQQNNLQFSNQDTYEIVFDEPYEDTSYTISLSSNKNINIWYTNKSSTGFTIRSEVKFSGIVDWAVINDN